MGKTYRKAFSLLLFLALLLLMLPASALAANSSLPVSVNLMSGSTVVGQVRVSSVDSSTINVTYTIDAGKAWTSSNKNGLVFKDITFEAMDNLVAKDYHQTFKTSDAASSSDLKTSYNFNLSVANLRSFTANAVVVNVTGPNPKTNTLTLVSGTNDKISNGSNAVEAYEPSSCWSGTTIGSHSNIVDLKGSGAKWIWQTYKVNAPVQGEISYFIRTFDIPAGATNISGSFKAVGDNAYIARVNNTFTTSHGFDATQYLTRAGLSTSGTDSEKMDRSFNNLSPGTATKPYFIESVVQSSAWSSADGSHTVSNLAAGQNTLEVKAMNEYMGLNDSPAQNAGTQDSNPAGLLYRLDVTYTTSFTAGTPYTASAQWTTYQVFYNGNGSDGGIVTSDSGAYATGATVQVKDPGTMSRTGFTFAGWTQSQNGSGTVYQANNTFLMGTANVTLYAQWTPKPVYCTVTFVTNGGSPVPPQQTVISGGLATVPDPVPTRSSYDFAGWYSDIGLNDLYDFSTPVTHDIILYARWTSTNPGGESFPIIWATPSYFEIFGD